MSMLHDHGKALLGKRYEEVSQAVTFLDVSDLARRYFTDGRDSLTFEHDLPGLLLPWPCAWLEYRFPQEMRFGGRRVPLLNLAGLRAAALAMWAPIGDGERALVVDPLYDLALLRLQGVQLANPADQFCADIEQRRKRLAARVAAGQLPAWLLNVSLAQEVDLGFLTDGALDGLDVINLGEYYLYLDAAGNAFPELTMMFSRVGLSRDEDLGFGPFAYAISQLNRDRARLTALAQPGAYYQKILPSIAAAENGADR